MRILIVRNNYNPKALESALLLEVYLASQGVEFTASIRTTSALHPSFSSAASKISTTSILP